MIFQVNPSVPKPVMVWIHGGGFVGGSTSRDLYSPDYFLSRDVVLVSVAYRLGLFGTLIFSTHSFEKDFYVTWLKIFQVSYP